MAITRDPNPVKNTPETSKKKEKAIESFIKKGGTPTVKTLQEEQDEVIKKLRLELTERELDMIKLLRDKRPRTARSRKIIISVNDWVVEAVNEKIERERKKYGV